MSLHAFLFSRIVSLAAFAEYSAQTADVTFSVACDSAQSNNAFEKTSSEKLYVQGGNKFFPVYTAIIQTIKGVPTSITFDEGCFFCDSGSSECVQNAVQVNATKPNDLSYQKGCITPSDSCVATANINNPDANSCDLKLFIAWTGTDASGTYMQSAGRRWSRFRQYALGLPTAWNELKAIASDAANRLTPSGFEETDQDPAASVAPGASSVPTVTPTTATARLLRTE
jgi:hypothetical protein